MTAIGPSFEGAIYKDPADESARHLQFSGHRDVQITIHTKTSKAKENIADHLHRGAAASKKDFVKIYVGSVPVLVRLSELAKQLHIPPKTLKAASSEGHLKETIDLALDALVANVPFESFSRKKSLERDLHASLAALDALVGQSVVTPSRKNVALTQPNINKMKEVVKTAYSTFVGTAGAGKTEVISTISSDLQLRIKISDKALTVATLFGKEIARGGGGKIARTSHALVLGKVDTGKHSVLKIPLEATEDTRSAIMQEVAISKRMNKNGPLLGFQESLSPRKITVPETRQEVVVHSGRLYDGDLIGARSLLELRDTMSIGYQMFHAVAAMHKEDITHGDIKLENFFFEKARKSTGIGPKVYLADLAGAIDHQLPQSKSQETFSAWRPLADVKSGRAIMKELNNEREKAASGSPREVSKVQKTIAELEQKFATNEKKADVFTACAAFALMATNPPELSEGEVKKDVVEHLQSLHFKDRLVQKGWSESFGALIEQGLSAKAEDRPTMTALLKACSKEVGAHDPALQKQLLAQSSPKLLKKIK